MKMLSYRSLDCTILYFFETHKIGVSLPNLTDFTGFRVFSLILHVRYMSIHKIVQFYKSTRDFDNIASRCPFFSTI